MNTYMALTLFCSFLHAVGAVLCKYGLENLKQMPDKNLKQIVLFLVRSKFWVLGIVVTLSTNVFVLQLQSVLDISVVQSILNKNVISASFWEARPTSHERGFWAGDPPLSRTVCVESNWD